MALRRPADPRNHAGNGAFHAPFPDVGPSVQKEIGVGFQLGELDAVVRLEGMAEVAAAIAHQLHLGLVFGVDGDELAPIALQAELLRGEVVGGGAPSCVSMAPGSTPPESASSTMPLVGVPSFAEYSLQKPGPEESKATSRQAITRRGSQA